MNPRGKRSWVDQPNLKFWVLFPDNPFLSLWAPAAASLSKQTARLSALWARRLGGGGPGTDHTQPAVVAEARQAGRYIGLVQYI